MHPWRALPLILAILLLLTGCAGSSLPPNDTPPPEPNTTPSDFRILFSSDLHCTDLREFYGTDYATRMQHWVNSVLAEHARNPIDLLVINGDISLDHAKDGGAHLLGRDVTAKTFVDDYVSQLPEEIEVFIMAGNHEQYANTRWYSITGNLRQGYRTLGNNLFIFLDTYNADLDPFTNSNGTYSGVDIRYAKELIEEYPNHNVYLIAHYFDVEAEPPAFSELLLTCNRIVGLFHGHTHRASVTQLGRLHNSLTIAQTGNFSYPNPEETNAFWGFRELVITGDSAYSRYIVTESESILNSNSPYTRRWTMLPVCYYGTMPKD